MKSLNELLVQVPRSRLHPIVHRPVPVDAAVNETLVNDECDSLKLTGSPSGDCPALFARRCDLSLLVATGSKPAHAQAEWVRRIDANGNGYIEPSEMSERAKSFLSRFSADYGIDLNTTQSVRRIEDAARQYFERRSRETTPPPMAPMPAIRGFGPDPDQAIIPDFSTT